MKINNRELEFPCNEVFPNRWSPRALSGEEISDEELMTLFEAGRWAPSSYNNQPWRFIYAKRDTGHWDSIFNLLADANKAWCKNAAVLVVVVSNKNFEYNGKPSRTHSLSAGAAWENIALQATFMGLVAHGMAGFDYGKAKEVLGVPDDFNVEMMFAIGKKGRKEDLSEEAQKMEVQSLRKPLKEIVFEGKFDG